MSLPLKFYKTISYIQLIVSIYATIWLLSFFVESVQCNMIENHPTVEPYVLHYSAYLLPECSAIGSEWLMGPWDSIILRIVMITWVVTSVYVFIRVQRIKKYVSSSEPIEFINPVKGEGSKSEKGKKKVSLIGRITDMVPKVPIPRLLRIILSVTAFWFVTVLLFQDSMMEYLRRYVEEDRFTGKIQDIVIRSSKDGVTSFYLYVDQYPIIFRSDKNISLYDKLKNSDNGVFYGLENFNLEDPFLSECLLNKTVEVYARRQNVYYSLDGESKYYIKFVSGTPTCQNIYTGKCIGNGTLYNVGEKMLFESEKVTCVCSESGFVCKEGISEGEFDSNSLSCSYFGSSYYSGQKFISEDGCGNCQCSMGKLSCTNGDCLLEEYDTTKEFILPLFYWFVDEPEPSLVVNLRAGRGDSYEVVAYKSFGQMPKTELNLANGKSFLIFSLQNTSPFKTSEGHNIKGNEDYPDMMRVYSSSLKKYVYVTKQLPDEVCDNTQNNEMCVKGDIGGIVVECISETSDYSMCDSVMKTFSVK